MQKTTINSVVSTGSWRIRGYAHDARHVVVLERPCLLGFGYAAAVEAETWIKMPMKTRMGKDKKENGILE